MVTLHFLNMQSTPVTSWRSVIQEKSRKSFYLGMLLLSTHLVGSAYIPIHNVHLLWDNLVALGRICTLLSTERSLPFSDSDHMLSSGSSKDPLTASDSESSSGFLSRIFWVRSQSHSLLTLSLSSKFASYGLVHTGWLLVSSTKLQSIFFFSRPPSHLSRGIDFSDGPAYSEEFVF